MKQVLNFLKAKTKKRNTQPSEIELSSTGSRIDFTITEIENINRVQDFTMTSPERLVAFSRAIDYIVKSNIEGDIVECGVWRGGSMMLAAIRLIQLECSTRRLFLFDTFNGMTNPTEADESICGKAASAILEEQIRLNPGKGWLEIAQADVESNILSTGYPAHQIHLVAGRIEETIPHKDIGEISILRLDTDWYESTLHQLKNLYDHVVPGGIVIIDDYGHWSGCKKAVDEFLTSRNLNVFLNRIDYTGRLFVKPK